VLMTLGDDRAVAATYVAGRCVYDRDSLPQFTYPQAQA
jgi:guanine deaminase